MYQKRMYLFWLEFLCLVGMACSTIYSIQMKWIAFDFSYYFAVQLSITFLFVFVFWAIFHMKDILRCLFSAIDALFFQFTSICGRVSDSKLLGTRPHIVRDSLECKLCYSPYHVIQYIIKTDRKVRRLVSMKYLNLDEGQRYTFVVGRLSHVIVDVLDRNGNSLWPNT